VDRGDLLEGSTGVAWAKSAVGDITTDTDATGKKTTAVRRFSYANDTTTQVADARR
jgi:hypothetical protein